MTTETLNVEYADWKLIRTRSSIQLIFEIPLENEAAAYALLGGMPSQGKSRWFKISRLSQQGAAQPQPVTPTIHPTPAGAVAKRKWNEMPFATRAAILGNDPVFWAFLRENFSAFKDVHNQLEAANAIRKFCCVDSRSHIVEESDAGDSFKKLDKHFDSWRLHEKVSA